MPGFNFNQSAKFGAGVDFAPGGCNLRFPFYLGLVKETTCAVNEPDFQRRQLSKHGSISVQYCHRNVVG